MICWVIKIRYSFRVTRIILKLSLLLSLLATWKEENFCSVDIAKDDNVLIIIYYMWNLKWKTKTIPRIILDKTSRHYDRHWIVRRGWNVPGGTNEFQGHIIWNQWYLCNYDGGEVGCDGNYCYCNADNHLYSLLKLVYWHWLLGSV